MGFIVESRAADSPYVESIMHGYTEGSGTVIRPAESNWHMVLTRLQGSTRFLLVGPLTSSGEVYFGGEAEILWIRLRLGVFMPHMPVRDYLNFENELPQAAGPSFWLNNSAWQYPNYENADTFINRLMRQDVLAYDPVVPAALQGRDLHMSPRTVRHRFLRATGQTQKHIHQFERAKQAQALLSRGAPALDVAFELGYYDQPHLTRSLRHFIGYTPGQLSAGGVV